MLDRQLGEVGVLVGGELPQDRLGHLRARLRRVERQAGLLDRKPVDVAVEDGERMGGQLDGEAPPQRIPSTASW